MKTKEPILITLSLAILLATTSARQTYTVKDEIPEEYRHQIVSYDYRQCLVESRNPICNDITVDWIMGWEWLQYYGSGSPTVQTYKYWTMMLNFFTQQNLNINPQISLDYFFFDLNFDVPQFKAGLYLQGLMAFLSSSGSDNLGVCFAVGPRTQQTEITLTVSMNFIDCYKVLLANFFDFSNF